MTAAHGLDPYDYSLLLNLQGPSLSKGKGPSPSFIFLSFTNNNKINSSILPEQVLLLLFKKEIQNYFTQISPEITS